MNATPYSQLAKQFMELWQKQMSTVLTDREFVHSMFDLMQTMQPPEPKPATPHAHKPQAANPAVSPDALLERLDQLDYRVRMLEKRLSDVGKPARRRPVRATARKPAAKRKRGS